MWEEGFGSAVLEVQCQRSPCSSDIPMAVVSMWSKHEDTLDPEPREQR